MKFFKYHGLGNDFIVISPQEMTDGLTPGQIRRICHRNLGIGADGILVGPENTDQGFGLRIFNADGSLAENSGNGARIFARFLFDQKQVENQPFSMVTAGRRLTARVDPDTRDVTVDMGRASFLSSHIPMTGPQREVLNETIRVFGQSLTYAAANVGNPHCVVLNMAPSETNARTFGPHIETDPRFPNKTNVQFMEVRDRSTIKIEIWERGVGYTLASGTSSCACAAVAKKLGLVDQEVCVHLAGGRLFVRVSSDFSLRLTGQTAFVFQGETAPEIFSDL